MKRSRYLLISGAVVGILLMVVPFLNMLFVVWRVSGMENEGMLADGRELDRLIDLAIASCRYGLILGACGFVLTVTCVTFLVPAPKPLNPAPEHKQ